MYYIKSTSRLYLETDYNNTMNNKVCIIVCANIRYKDSQQGLPVPQPVSSQPTANNEGCLSDVEYSRRDFIDMVYA
jgi:hypothetical protein